LDSSELSKKKYKNLVDEASPNSNVYRDCLKAFAVGGAICCIGQALNNLWVNLGASMDEAGAYTAIALVLSSVLLTGLGVYDKLGKHAGAGSFVPITGFANAMAAPAVEFKREGFIMGVGAKMFTVAGPVIVYGTLASIVVGLVYYILK
jgi:stage V sporulation protein AC